MTFEDFFKKHKCSSAEKIRVLQFLALIRGVELATFFEWWD